MIEYYRSAESSFPVFAFDINGLKGPNKPGYDLFSISIDNHGSGYHFNEDLNGCWSPINDDVLFTTLEDIY